MLHSKTQGVGNSCEHELVVSLTTFKKRIEEVYLAIESLMQQSLKADRIVLCISKEDFTPESTPAALKEQTKRGLEILYCEKDLGPYTKYFYTLQKYPNALLITADDDVIYPTDTIDLLYRTYLKHPNSIVCHRAHRMRYDSSGQLLPYREWIQDQFHPEPHLDVFPTGIGGVLYFPDCFAPDVIDEEAFLQLCPGADDVWLKAMSLKKGVRCVTVDDHRPWKRRFHTIDNSQQVALKHTNLTSSSNGNDRKIKQVFTHYKIGPQTT
jgi:hypothetical protein